jgi:hypothetical protein
MQKPRYSPEDEQMLMAQLWSPSIKDDPEAFVLFAFPWGQKNTPLEHFKAPRAWQRRALRRIAEFIRINRGKLNNDELIDALRRRGKRIFVNIDDFAETLPGETPEPTASPGEVTAQLQALPARQRDVLQSIAVDSASIKDTAAKFSMTEGAVRVALHRGLASLTEKLRDR